MSPIAMSSSATPQPLSGYASPASSVSHLSRLSPTPSHSKSHHPKHKPVNVFSNDGTFLERFQQLKRDEDERKKQQEMIARKREFDNRFRMRGKRPLPPDESSNDSTEIPAKKPKVDEPSSHYQQEVQGYSERSLKDEGNGVRPLVR